VPTIPNEQHNERLQRNGDTLTILPYDNSIWGIVSGGVLATAGVALIICGKNDTKNYTNFYLAGGATGVTGLIMLGIFLYNRNLNKKPLVTLDKDGIFFNGENIAWDDLGNVQSTYKTYTYKSSDDYQVWYDGKPIIIEIPTTKTGIEEFIGLIPRDAHLNLSYIDIPVDKLPISEEECVNILKDYQKHYSHK